MVIADPRSVYIAGQVLQKSLAIYPNKVDGQQAVSDKKSKLIYSVLDAHPESYKVVPDKSARSRMNICFRVTHVCFTTMNHPHVANLNQLEAGVDESEKSFLKGAVEAGLQGLKGHRSVGGIRASNYNSISLEGAEKLAKYIEQFASGPKK